MNDHNELSIGPLGLKPYLKQQMTSMPYYTAPETLHGQYTLKSDIWSIGCIIYELLTFQPPFNGSNVQTITQKIQLGKFVKLGKSYKSHINNLVYQMISIKQDQRPNCDTILKYLDKCDEDFQNSQEDPFLNSRVHIKNVSYLNTERTRGITTKRSSQPDLNKIEDQLLEDDQQNLTQSTGNQNKFPQIETKFPYNPLSRKNLNKSKYSPSHKFDEQHPIQQNYNYINRTNNNENPDQQQQFFRQSFQKSNTSNLYKSKSQIQQQDKTVQNLIKMNKSTQFIDSIADQQIHSSEQIKYDNIMNNSKIQDNINNISNQQMPILKAENPIIFSEEIKQQYFSRLPVIKMKRNNNQNSHNNSIVNNKKTTNNKIILSKLDINSTRLFPKLQQNNEKSTLSNRQGLESIESPLLPLNIIKAQKNNNKTQQQDNSINVIQNLENQQQQQQQNQQQTDLMDLDTSKIQQEYNNFNTNITQSLSNIQNISQSVDQKLTHIYNTQQTQQQQEQQQNQKQVNNINLTLNFQNQQQLLQNQDKQSQIYNSVRQRKQKLPKDISSSLMFQKKIQQEQPMIFDTNKNMNNQKQQQSESNKIIFMIDVAKVVQNKNYNKDNSQYLSIVSPH